MGAEKSMNVNNNYAVRQGTSAAVTERTARYLAFKRFMDIVFALAGLLAALPVMGPCLRNSFRLRFRGLQSGWPLSRD